MRKRKGRPKTSLGRGQDNHGTSENRYWSDRIVLFKRYGFSPLEKVILTLSILLSVLLYSALAGACKYSIGQVEEKDKMLNIVSG